MNAEYDKKDDILLLKFNSDKIIRDISLNWNVHVGMTADGVGEISILEASKQSLPLKFNKSFIKQGLVELKQ